MSDEYGQIRPERDDYLEDIEAIRTDLAAGKTLYVEHAWDMTGHKLLLVPGSTVKHFVPPWGTRHFNFNSLAVFYLGHKGPVFAHTDGSDWVHFSYAAEKFGIEQYPGDAVSLANLINRILGWGDDRMQTLEKALAR